MDIKVIIDVFRKYSERPTQRIQPNHLGLTYTDSELNDACSVLVKTGLLDEFDGFGNFNEYELTGKGLEISIDSFSKELTKRSKNKAEIFGDIMYVLGRLGAGFTGIYIGFLLFKYLHGLP